MSRSRHGGAVRRLVLALRWRGRVSVAAAAVIAAATIVVSAAPAEAATAITINGAWT